MVSPLSARLLGSTAKGFGNKRKHKHTAMEAKNGRGVRTSGYLADREQASNSPTLPSFELTVRDNTFLNRSACPKRRKISELQFAVSNVKKDITRAGLDFPKVKTCSKKETTSIKEATIDFNGVELKKSEKAEPAFIIPALSKTTTIAEYEDLVASCKHFYPQSVPRKKTRVPKAHVPVSSSDESDSSTSSATESDSTVDATRAVKVHETPLIVPLLENALATATTTNKHKPSESSCQVLVDPGRSITLTDALALSSKARLVTQSSFPFRVIHANAALFRLLGDNVVGKDLADIFSPKEENNSDEGATAFDNGSMLLSSSSPGQPTLIVAPHSSSTTTTTTSCEKQQTFQMVATPVVEQVMQHKALVTVGHISFDLESVVATGTNTHHPTADQDLKVDIKLEEEVAPLGVVG